MRRLCHLAAVLLAAWVVSFGLQFRTGVASGADSYGYVSEADLWLKGDLHVPQPFMDAFPWPKAESSMAPMGYRPAHGDNTGFIVPIYSPGLPLMMAAVKAVVGYKYIFMIVPVFGGLFVLATYGIGLRVANPAVGLGAAAIVATSPVALFMAMWPMTDLVVASLWAVATWCLLGPTRRDACLGGLAAAAALVVRPNLIFIGIGVGLWTIYRDVRRNRREDGASRAMPWWAVDRAVAFTVGVLPGVLGIMVFNWKTYGSPFVSGYGSLGEVLHLSTFPDNARNYFSWFVETQSWWAVIGLVPLALPIPAVWGSRERAEQALLFTAIALGTSCCFLFFMRLDEWWYLRFFLSLWPGIFVGLALWLLAPPVPWLRQRPVLHALYSAAGLLVIAAIVQWSADYRAYRRFGDVHDGERRFVTAAQLVRDRTEPNAIVYSYVHAGSLRYYGERMSLKYDGLDPAWLERSVEWFRERGVHPYAFVEEWEIAHWRQHFNGASPLARLDMAPVLEISWPTHMWLFDLANPVKPATWPFVDAYQLPHPPPAVPQAPPPVFELRAPGGLRR